MSAKEKEAAAKQTFGFPAQLASEPPAQQAASATARVHELVKEDFIQEAV